MGIAPIPQTFGGRQLNVIARNNVCLYPAVKSIASDACVMPQAVAVITRAGASRFHTALAAMSQIVALGATTRHPDHVLFCCVSHD